MTTTIFGIKRSKVSLNMDPAENVPFTHTEIKEWRDSMVGKRNTLQNVGENRAKRREQIRKGNGLVFNNRSNPNKRRRALHKQITFHQSLLNKIQGFR